MGPCKSLYDLHKPDILLAIFDLRFLLVEEMTKRGTFNRKRHKYPKPEATRHLT